HLLLWLGRGLQAAASQNTQELERGVVGVGLLQCGRGRRCLRERLVGAELSAPETLALLRVFLCAAEQRAADRFHAHPSFWVCIDGRAIALQPERGRGGDVRGRGRRYLAGHVAW